MLYKIYESSYIRLNVEMTSKNIFLNGHENLKSKNISYEWRELKYNYKNSTNYHMK